LLWKPRRPRCWSRPARGEAASPTAGCVNVDASKSVNRNEEFDCRIDVDVNVVVKQARPSVSFSHLRVREYEVTLEDNPSVSSGTPLSLGWRYDPREKVSSLEYRIGAGESPLRPRRSQEDLRMSDVERLGRLSSVSNVSFEDIREALRGTGLAKMERERSMNDLRMQVAKERREHFALETKKAAMLEPAGKRRSGITDGGLGVSESIVLCPDLLYR